MSMYSSWRLKCIFGCCIVLFVLWIVEFAEFSEEFHNESYDEGRSFPLDERQDFPDSGRERADLFMGKIDLSIKEPVLVWWTPLTGEKGRVRSCGQHKCFFTVNRNYSNHQNSKGFLFYGTEFNEGNLPLPRTPDKDWALLHEESPKNKYLFSHKEAMELFNHTSTFKRESHQPIATQYLESISYLESQKLLVPTSEKTRLQKDEGLALVNYIQSDCGCPSDRDHLVQKLQRLIKVDSYGKCEHNKDLPKHLQNPVESMEHEDLMKLQAKYKFTLVFENAICDDYITEKLWRPLHAGSVPIYLGSPKIMDYLPNEKSAILVKDFTSVSDLVNLLQHLNSNDAEYESYLSFKTSGVTNNFLKKEMSERKYAINNDPIMPNFIDNFECLVCERVHENLARQEKNQPLVKYQATVEHYGCPRPKKFVDRPVDSLMVEDNVYWGHEWDETKAVSAALKILIDSGHKFSAKELKMKAHEIQSKQIELK